MTAFAWSTGLPAQGQSGLIEDGKIGFVVNNFRYALAPDSDFSAACPQGLTLGARDAFAASPDGQRREGETGQEYTRRSAVGVRALMQAPTGQNLCLNSELGAPDLRFHPVIGDASLWADGLDLDRQVSRANGRAAGGTCAHDDFRGERGVDNPFYRVAGCIGSFQSAMTGCGNSEADGIFRR